VAHGKADAGEQILTVPPLELPPPEAILEVAAASDAVSLFVQRARRVDADFAVTSANVSAVAEVCRRLDGVPLAIELAAAQIATMTPQELAQDLDRRFDTLAGGRRGVVPRHQTLMGCDAGVLVVGQAGGELSGGEHCMTLDVESYRVDRALLGCRGAATASGMACH
jgi:hypothetical protein